ncbi:MAG: hypothetical protein M3R10_08785, partial [Verrucomicrobiota bacterium]|nr:hypothetical protein [Verrucomicrobiota bacterium]
MPGRIFLTLLSVCGILGSIASARADGLVSSHHRFYYRSTTGGVSSARIIRHYFVPVIHPDAAIDPRIDPR